MVVTIPGGTVLLDAREAVVAPFAVDRNLVTVAAYRAFLYETRALPPAEWEEQLRDERLPVTRVSPVEAARFAAWAGGRLPTEAEWQLASAGFGQGRAYPWGERPDASRGPTSWRFALPWRRPRPVGTGAPRGDGLFGVSDLGELWELTSSVAPHGSVVRGGVWRDREELPPRLDNRSHEHEPAHDVGFRCVYAVPRAEPRDAYVRPRLRDPADRDWRRELFATREGLHAYFEQELTRAGVAFRCVRPPPTEAARFGADGASDAEVARLSALERTLLADMALLDDPDFVRRDREMVNARLRGWHSYEIGDPHDRYYTLMLERENGLAERDGPTSLSTTWVIITHSRTTGGVDGPRQPLVFGTTSTRLPLDHFARLELDLHQFVRYVMAQFEGNYDSPT